MCFSLLNGLGTLAENHLTTYIKVYFWALYFILLVYRPVFMPVPHYLDFVTLWVSFKIKNYENFSFVFLSFPRLFWTISGPLRFYINFRKEFSISAKKNVIRAWCGTIALHLQVALGSIGILIRLDLTIHEHKVLFICVLFNCF